MRLFILVVAAVAPLAPPPPAAAPKADAGSPAVVCRVPKDVHRREYRLQRVGGVWQLALRATTTGERWVALPLPHATPVFGRTKASLSYRSAYGGRTVRLTVGPTASSLDVYANYELEVNVDPNLDPRIDLLNTNGPLTGLSCRITTAPPR